MLLFAPVGGRSYLFGIRSDEKRGTALTRSVELGPYSNSFHVRGVSLGPWLVINTKPNAERGAVVALSAPYRGFEVYYPQIIRRISHAGSVRDVERPFLPRMLFVRDDGSRARAINSCPGVSSIMKFGTTLALLGDWVLNAIRGRETQAPRPDKSGEIGNYVDLETRYVPTMAHKFELDEEVRITGGPFRDFNAIFEAQDRDRVQVAVMIFGRATRAYINLDQLEKL